MFDLNLNLGDDVDDSLEETEDEKGLETAAAEGPAQKRLI